MKRRVRPAGARARSARSTAAARAIRRLIEDWAAAVRARKLEAVVANHTAGILMFDVPPPVAVRGLSDYERTWPPFFDWQNREDGTFEIAELDVAAGDTVAFATALLRCGSRAELATDNTPRLRLTIGLKKVRGAWQIAHEHHSFPLES